MAVKEKFVKDVAVLTVSGKLMGGKDTWEVHDYVKRLISEGMKKIVFDLSHVKWLNSQGIGMLMTSMTSLKNVGGQMVIAGAATKVKSILMITNLITIFKNAETVEEAMTKFS
jgi:anti-sigma B factor antagonist